MKKLLKIFNEYINFRIKNKFNIDYKFNHNLSEYNTLNFKFIVSQIKRNNISIFSDVHKLNNLDYHVKHNIFKDVLISILNETNYTYDLYLHKIIGSLCNNMKNDVYSKNSYFDIEFDGGVIFTSEYGLIERLKSEIEDIILEHFLIILRITCLKSYLSKNDLSQNLLLACLLSICN